MTDPASTLPSLQQAILRGQIKLCRAALDPDLYLHVDYPLGDLRHTYVRLHGKTVTACVMFALSPPIKGKPCFGIAYAVPEAYRNQGRAKDAVKAAISEMRYGLGRLGRRVFYIEAIVGADNEPSQHVAEKFISDTPVPVTDKLSGLRALQYVRKIIYRPKKRS